MKTQLLRSRNATMQKCRKMFYFCVFALLHFCFTFAQTPGLPLYDNRDGQTYKTVIMPDGKRWMAENLRYRKGLDNPVFGYRGYGGATVTSNIAAPGTNLQKTYYCPGPGPFPTSPNTNTTSQADPLRCEYEGCLYPFWTAYGQNQGTANVFTTLGEQGVCPNGWHLPSDVEWTNLTTALSNNFSSLLVLNAGFRSNTGIYSDRTSKAYFWTSTGSGTAAVSRTFSGNTVARNASQPASDALSVRCVEGDCDEGFHVQFARAVCNFTTQANAAIEYTSSKKTIVYELSVPGTSGTWNYAFVIKNNTVSTAPSFVISNNNTANAFVTLNFSSLSSADDNRSFTLSATATNPAYCKIKQEFVFTMNDISSQNAVTTITGGEAVNTIRQMTDSRDNKVYEIIKMADGKWWMRENLNYQKGLTFRSASNQPFTSATNGVPGIGNFWCGNASLADCDKWGALYTWEAAVSTDGVGTWSEPPASQLYTQSASGNPTSICNRGICPQGWHVPSDGEWGDMLNAVETGIKNHTTTTGWIGTNAGTALKSSGFTTGVKQSSGFSVFAAGYRYSNGSGFGNRGSDVAFWTASGYGAAYAWYRQFSSSYTTVSRSNTNSYRSNGFSVRCLQD